MLLRLNGPYEQALMRSLSARVDAARELIETDEVDKYRAWWVEMRRKGGEDPSDEEADRFAKLYQGFTRKVANEGYDPSDKNPIKVTIQADGRLGCNDGNHRLCALFASGAKSVEVVLGWVSPTWKDLVDSLKGVLHHPHPHPSFYGWKCNRPGSRERYTEVGKRLVEMGCKTAFEIGPCSGTGVQALVDAGLKVSWAEIKLEFARLCKSLSSVRKSSKQVSTLSESPDVDAVVALAVYHHVATSVEAFEAAAARMGLARVQVVELPTAEAPRWHARFVEESGQTAEGLPEWTLNRLQEAGSYTNVEVLREEPYGNRTTWIMWR